NLLRLGGFEGRVHADDGRPQQLQPEVGNDPGAGVFGEHADVRPLGDARVLEPARRLARGGSQLVMGKGKLAHEERWAWSARQQCLSQVAATKVSAGGLGVRRNLASFLSMDRP